jgi:toxin ParE1/3/4
VTRQLVYTESAEADLDKIFDFIAVDNPRRARSYIEEIRQACRDLCKTPLIGVERADLRPGLRIFPLWRRIVIAYGSFEFRVGYAALGLIRVKSSFPAMRKRTVRMVVKRV